VSRRVPAAQLNRRTEFTPVHVVIRVDSSDRIGSGHLMRCLSLAYCLRKHGATIQFISREHPEHLIRRAEDESYQVMRLPAPLPGSTTDGEYASWRGVPETLDANETIAAIGEACPDWLVVDHYGLGREFESVVAPFVKRMMVIDDIGRAHACDLLLDQNWVGNNGPTRYDGLVPEHCCRLLGPGYALLQPEYATLQRRRSDHSAVRRVLVFFGGSDQTNETGKVLKALSQPRHAGLVVDIVLGSAHPMAAQIRRSAARRPLTRVHSSIPSLASLIADADVCIGAAGTTTWERLSLEVPSIVVTQSDNQVSTAKALAQSGYIRWIGSVDETDAERYSAELSNPPMRINHLPRLVDGHGARRCCEVMRVVAGAARNEPIRTSSGGKAGYGASR
jgi:UDP-2,4-diacetamido-2,4,6-trideoxy-beta-L-altropyranose hydrolase